MARIQKETTAQALTQDFMAEFLDSRRHLLPGGGRVDAAAFSANAEGRKPIRGGILVGRDRGGDDLWRPATVTTGVLDHDEVYLIAYPVDDALENDEVELLRPGFLVKENFLPGWATLDPALQAYVRETYHTIEGSLE